MGRRLTLEDLQATARERGGECLSTKYINSTTKCLWRCSEGHEWKATAGVVRNRTWCPECSGNTRQSIEDLQVTACERGGSCLSTKYINGKTKYLWRCSEGHEWEATAGHVRNNGSWCPKCSGVAPLSLYNLKEIANERGGLCLSTEYVNGKTKYLWRCLKGHEWEATGESLRSGSWCPKCSGLAPLSLDALKKTANEHGGECLSTEYINNRHKYLWRCSEGHEWEAKANNLRSGSWCPKCSGLAPLSLDALKEMANERGGECLSVKYFTIREKYLWSCSEGHRWKSSATNIREGCWCPTCASGKSERFTMEFIESIFDISLSKIRPKWLHYKKGRPLEIDGFHKELSIGIEYQGQQHYEEIDHFHRHETAFTEQKERDAFKAEKCREHGIILVTVGYFEPKWDDRNKRLSILLSMLTAFKQAGRELPEKLIEACIEAEIPDFPPKKVTA